MTIVNHLSSWNEGPAKATILAFVQGTTDPASPEFIAEKGSHRHV
jgi:hypothetical protein